MESQLTRYRSIFAPGADAGFRVRGGASGVSRISARGVLKVRPHTKRGGGEGPVRSRSDIRKVGGGGGGGNSLQVRYEKWGGGPFRFRSDTFVWHTENSYMYLPTCYLGILHTRARMNVKYMQAKVNLFVIHMLGGACALHAPPKSATVLHLQLPPRPL